MSESKEIQVKNDKAPIVIGNRGIELSNLNDLYRFAQYVVQAGFAPKGMEKPESVLIAVEMGMEVGLKPMQSLQNIAVINGRPTVWGDAALGLVESSGLQAGFREWIDGTGDKAVAHCWTQRVGRDPVERTFSIDDAKRAGLLSKTGPWAQYPQRMLQMRARGFALRDTYPDVLRGLHLTEEVQPPIDVTPTPEPPKTPKAKPRTMSELADTLDAAPVVVADVVVDREPGQEPEPTKQELMSIIMERASTIDGATYDALLESIGMEPGTALEDMTRAELRKLVEGLGG